MIHLRIKSLLKLCECLYLWLSLVVWMHKSVLIKLSAYYLRLIHFNSAYVLSHIFHPSPNSDTITINVPHYPILVISG